MLLPKPEVWKLTHDARYSVSNMGRVKSVARGAVRILRFGYADGYPQVSIQQKKIAVHRLVANAFLGPCPKGQEVRHKNDVRADPQVTNLEYGTRSQNIQDCVLRGRYNRPQKLSPVQREAIRTSSARGVDLAREHQISAQHVCNLRRGRR